MIKQCLYCKKEFSPKRNSALFDTAKCKLAYHRINLSVSKIEPVSVSKDLSVSKTAPTTKELTFTTESIEERIRLYQENYPNSPFIPNWIAHGFNSKEDAIKHALSGVRKSVGVQNASL